MRASIRICTWLIAGFLGLVATACGYRYVVGPLQPAPESRQQPRMSVQDDGTVLFTRDRLEVSLRPLTDAELNRQFAPQSDDGLQSANPFTYGDWVDPETGETPQRFTVFLVKIKNYAFPKVLVDPGSIRLLTDVGREYRPHTFLELDDYYLAYVTGYAGNAHQLYEERRDILRRSMLKRELVFSGQELSGYVVFPVLHHAVGSLRVRVEDVALRFDYRDEPIESEDLEYAFERRTGRVYPGRPAAGDGDGSSS